MHTNNLHCVKSRHEKHIMKTNVNELFKMCSLYRKKVWDVYWKYFLYFININIYNNIPDVYKKFTLHAKKCLLPLKSIHHVFSKNVDHVFNKVPEQFI